MFELSLSPAIAPAFAPVLTAPAVGTGDFALALAEVTAEVPAAIVDTNAVVLPPDRQILAAPADAHPTPGTAPIPVLDVATPIIIPRFLPPATQQAPQSRAAAPLTDVVTVAKSPAKAVLSPAQIRQTIGVIPIANARQAATTNDDPIPERDRDEGAAVATLILAPLPIALPLVQAAPAASPGDGRVGIPPAVSVPALALPQPPIKLEATVQPDPVARPIIDPRTPTIDVGKGLVPRSDALAAPVHATDIAPGVRPRGTIIDLPIAFATPVPVLIRPGAVDSSPPVPTAAPTPVPAQGVAADRLASVLPAPVAPTVIGVPVPALRAFAVAIAATNAAPVRVSRGGETPNASTASASARAIAVRPDDVSVTRAVAPGLPVRVPDLAIAPSPSLAELVVQSTHPAGRSRDDDATVTPLTIAAPSDLATRPLDATTRSLPPVDMRREDWTRALIDRIDAVRDVANARDTRITLVPDSLGKIEVALRQDGETLHVAFVADAPATRLLLVEAQPRLVELAEARGLKLGDTAVSANPDGDRTGSSFGQTADQRRPVPAPQGSASNRSTTTSPAPDRADSDNRIA